MHKKLIKAERETRFKKITDYDHKGFDFAGAAGQDVLITDNLKNRIFTAFNTATSTSAVLPIFSVGDPSTFSKFTKSSVSGS